MTETNGQLESIDFISTAKVIAVAPELVMAALSVTCGRPVEFDAVARRINIELARRGWRLIAPLEPLRYPESSPAVDLAENQPSLVVPDPRQQGRVEHVRTPASDAYLQVLDLSASVHGKQFFPELDVDKGDDGARDA